MTDASHGFDARPLGRSLDPLPGESLAGFVQRLAHRLHISPDQLMRRTGLVDIRRNTQAKAKSSWSTYLPPPPRPPPSPQLRGCPLPRPPP